MRTFLLTIFWFTNIGNVIQLLIVVWASSIIYSGAYSFSDLNVNVFITQYIPWLIWMKTFIIELFGDLGGLILSIPILIVAPLKFVTGTMVGLWAYSVAQDMPVEQAHN